MKRIEYDPEMYWPTVIINEGTPYVLKKCNRRGVNDPCELCDLRLQCYSPNENHRLVALCTSDDRGQAWYFEEDWTIYDKNVSEFLNQDYKDIQDNLEEENRIKDLTLKHDL